MRGGPPPALATAALGTLLALAPLAAGCGGGGGESAAPALELRRTPDDRLSPAQVEARLAELGLFDRRRNPEGRGAGAGEGRFLVDGEVVLDAATGLAWQRRGSPLRLSFADAERSAAELSRDELGGFSDWRLPTLEEAMSLAEPRANAAGLHLDPIFGDVAWWVWTADRAGPVGGWVVTYADGTCFVHVAVGGSAHLRAVRGPAGRPIDR